MAERKNAEFGLVDAWTANLGGPRTAALLGRLDRAVPWGVLVKPIAALPEYRGGERGGRPAWPALTTCSSASCRPSGSASRTRSSRRA